MNYDSYAEGFCKTAAALGVDPVALVKAAQSREQTAKMYGVPANGKSQWTPTGPLEYYGIDPARKEPVAQRFQQLSQADEEALGELTRGHVDHIVGKPGMTAGDVVAAREAVLNPNDKERLATSLLSPRAMKIYSAATNAYDHATSPFLKAPKNTPVTPAGYTGAVRRYLDRFIQNNSGASAPKANPSGATMQAGAVKASSAIDDALAAVKGTASKALGAAKGTASKALGAAKGTASKAVNAASSVAGSAKAKGQRIAEIMRTLAARMDKNTVHRGIGGTLLGATAGYALTDGNASQKKKIRNIALGAGAGAVTGVGADVALKPSAEQIAARKAAVLKMLAGLRTKVQPA